MNTKYREALPLLKEKLSFTLEEISGTDLFYNDGDSHVLKSFFKLVFPKAVVYISEKEYWISYGSLTEKESSLLKEWIDSIVVS